MQEILIKAETVSIKDAFVNFLKNYKVQIAQYMNALLGNDGTPTDSTIIFDDSGEIAVYQIAPDKGFVVGEVGDDSKYPVQIVQYNDLDAGKKYLVFEDNRVILYLKETSGSPDFKLGAFRTLSDAVIELNSAEVKKAQQDLADFKEARLKDAKRTEKRLARLSKNTEEITDIQEEEKPVMVKEENA